jgi:hypothetical protein
MILHPPVKPHVLYQLDRRADERRSPSRLGDIRKVLIPRQVTSPETLLLQFLSRTRGCNDTTHGRVRPPSYREEHLEIASTRQH